jgi:hypothetical protein
VIAGTFEFMTESVVYILVCGYFYYVSQYWQFLLIPTLFTGIVGALIILVFLPETPRFLIASS